MEESVKRFYRATVGGVVLVAVIILFGGQAIAYVKAGYPSDAIRREALDHCAAADIHFLRFSEKDRTDCYKTCLLYTSDAADDLLCVDLGGRRIIKKKKT